MCSASRKRGQGSQTAAVVVPIPCGRTELCAVRVLARWLSAAEIADLPVFRRIYAPAAECGQPPSPAGCRPGCSYRAVRRAVRRADRPLPRGVGGLQIGWFRRPQSQAQRTHERDAGRRARGSAEAVRQAQELRRGRGVPGARQSVRRSPARQRPLMDEPSLQAPLRRV